MKLILFESDATNFNSNGIGVLVDTIRDEITEESNGEFELYLEYPENGLWVDEIQDQRIIRGKPSDVDGPHNFRIYEIKKSLDTGVILVSATTATNDLGGNLVTEVNRSGTPQELMLQAMANLVEPTNINFISDIQTDAEVNWVRRNPLNCIAGEEGSLIQIFGGEIKRTDRTIYLYKRRGRDTGMVVRQNRHINGFDMYVNTKGIVTRILPFFTYIPEGQEDEVTVTGSIVDSPLVNNYPVRTIRPIDYSGDDDVTDLASLNAKASDYFTVQNPEIDKPNVTIEVDMIQLADSPEYEKFKHLETIGLTDKITVYVPKHKVDVELKVTKLKYSSTMEHTLSLEAGSTRPTFYDGVKDTHKQRYRQLDKRVDDMDNVIQTAANRKNRNYRGELEPTEGMIPNDLWYKPVGDGEVMMYRYDGSKWELEKVSAGLLGGKLDATNGDVDLINVNVSTLVGGISEFVRSYWNGINSSVQIDSNGFRLNSPNGTVIIDGTSNMHKILATGIMNVNVPAGSVSYNASIAHNLGYIPAFSAFMQGDSSYPEEDGFSFALPRIVSAPGGDSLVMQSTIKGEATSSRFYVRVRRAQNYGSALPAKTIVIRYFIYKEVAF